ncbi:MAG: hypothetical protein QOE61_36 [Micromonosporaceae bacterium]|jgi:hypothetical protein|nr:hypothetical protein [Micromonosporaceae bacterium]
MQPILPATAKHQLTPCANSSGTVQGGNALCSDPGQFVANAVPEVIVAAAGQRLPAPEPQQRVGRQYGAAQLGVFGECGSEVERDGLPAHHPGLLP